MSNITFTPKDGRILAEFGNSVVGKHRHDLPAVAPETEGLEPVNWVKNAYRVLADLMEEATKIQQDTRYAAAYKLELLAPIYGQAIDNVARLGFALGNYERAVDAEEAAIYALPEPHPTAAVLGQREVEIREWFRGLNLKGRQEARAAISNGTAGEEVERALMRSPIAHLDSDARVIVDAWKDRKRKENIDRVMTVESKRAALDRAYFAAKNIQGTTESWTRWDRTRDTLNHLMRSTDEAVRGGYRIFGFDEADIARWRLMQRAAERSESLSTALLPGVR